MDVKDISIKKLAINVKNNRLLIAISFSINLCALALPIYTLQAYDRIIVHQNMSTFFIVTAGAFAFILLEFVFRVLRGNLTSYYSNTSIHNEFIKAINQFARLKSEKLQSINLAEKSNIINELSKTNDFIYRQLYVALVDILFLFLFLSVIALLSLKLSATIILTLSIFTIIAIKINSSLIKKYKDRSQSDDKRAAGIIDFLRSIFVAKTHSNELIFLQKQDVIERKSVINTYNLSISLSFLYNFSTFTTQLLVVITLIIGSSQIMNGGLTFGTLIAIILIVGRLTNPIREMLTIWFKMSSFLSSSKKIIDFYKENTRDYLDKNTCKNYRYLLDIDDLSIKESYKSNNLVFDSLSIKLNIGDCVAITHVNSHMHALLKSLLTGGMKPEFGSITVSGNPLYKLTSEQYYQSVAYITIEEQYLNGTILENITGGRDIPDDEIDELCQMLSIKDEIIQLDHGFQTTINSNTIQELSMNLRMKILLARSYLKKPSLVIIDTHEEYIDEDFYLTLFKFIKQIKNKSAILLVSNDYNMVSLANYSYLADEKKYDDFSFNDAIHMGAIK